MADAVPPPPAAAGGGGGPTTGQANPSTASSGSGQASGGSSSTGQSNPSGGSSSTGQSNPSGGSSSDDSDTGQADPGGDDGTTEPTSEATTPTTTSSPSPSTAPAATPITATERAPWEFRWSPTTPEGGCGPDSRVDGKLSEECQDFQRAYGNTSSFSCDHATDGRMFCEQQDGNRDMVVEGTVTLSSANLSRYVPSQDKSNTADMSGAAAPGSDPGLVCSMSGSSTETVFRTDESTGRVPGTWSATRNVAGC